MTGKPITPEQAAQQELLAPILAAVEARIRLGVILYDPQDEKTKDPETGETQIIARRQDLTDQQIFERAYSAQKAAPGYTRAAFARDFVPTIEKLLVPLREAYGPTDTDLRRGGQFLHYLQTYRQEVEADKKGKKRGRPSNETPPMSQVLKTNNVNEKDATKIIDTLKEAAAKGCPTLAATIANLYEKKIIPKAATASDIWHALNQEGIRPKKGWSQDNFTKRVNTARRKREAETTGKK